MVGSVPIGGGAPISVQSMTKTDPRNVRATRLQVKRLEKEGCGIIRLAVPDLEAAEALKSIKKGTTVPLIADIHFDYRLALASLEAGVDGLRINPGTIGPKNKVREVVKAAKERNVPMRIGVNAGSLEKPLLNTYGGPAPKALVESALGHVRILEEMDFTEIKISVKTSNIRDTLECYRMLAEKVDYPFHAGITEAGGMVRGTVKSSAGLALLIREGLADTIRVSLTAPPEEEVKTAFILLSALGLDKDRLNIISCPTCGRCRVDLIKITKEIEKGLAGVKGGIQVAVMGCAVNGPGEAKEADIGVACGRRKGLLFKKGKVVSRIKEEEIVSVLVREVIQMADERNRNDKRLS